MRRRVAGDLAKRLAAEVLAHGCNVSSSRVARLARIPQSSLHRKSSHSFAAIGEGMVISTLLVRQEY
jgi:glycine cleavage system regulatory protein